MKATSLNARGSKGTLIFRRCAWVKLSDWLQVPWPSEMRQISGEIGVASAQICCRTIGASWANLGGFVGQAQLRRLFLITHHTFASL